MNRNAHRRTISHVKTGLIKGTTSTYTTTVASKTAIDGKWSTDHAVQTNTATPTTDARTGLAFVAQTDNQASVYVFGVNAAGDIKVAQGGVEATEVGSGATAGAFKLAPQFPALPDNFTPIGYLLVRTAPDAADFTFGTSSWTATGITASAVTEVDGQLPDRPSTT